MIILRDGSFLYATLSTASVLPVVFNTSYEADTVGHNFSGTVLATPPPSRTQLTDTITKSGISRIKYVSIYNPNALPTTVLIETVDEAESPPVSTSQLKVTLNSGDTLFYEEEIGWYVLNSIGARKIVSS